MPKTMLLFLAAMITIAQVSKAEPVGLAPVDQHDTLQACVYAELVDLLNLVKTTGALRSSRQLRAATALAREECVDGRGLAAKANLDDDAIDRIIDAALIRAVKYVYMSVDS